MKSDTETYRTLLEPVLFLLDIESKYKIEHDNLRVLYGKYKDELFKNKHAILEIRELIAKTIAVCLNKINEKYRKKIAAIYTEDGLDTILFDHLYSKIVEGITED